MKKIVVKEIRNDLLLTEEEYLTVNVPSVDCILADKLTAFAPHTIGVELSSGRNMEVMKQFYDVSSLTEIFENQDIVLHTYESIAKTEIAYRGLYKTPAECLWDTFHTALCIASRGKINAKEYPMYVKGIRELRGHIYAENYNPEIAAGRSVKIAYLIACLLTGTRFETAIDFRAYSGYKLTCEDLLPLRYLKKANPESYAYAVKTDEVMKSIDHV